LASGVGVADETVLGSGSEPFADGLFQAPSTKSVVIRRATFQPTMARA
jgi:hypothetical protein